MKIHQSPEKDRYFGSYGDISTESKIAICFRNLIYFKSIFLTTLLKILPLTNLMDLVLVI